MSLGNTLEERKTKICITVTQFFGYGKIGGFGSFARRLAIALEDVGYDVSILCFRFGQQKPFETLNSIKIYGVTPLQAFQKKYYQRIDADIYHSQNPSILTFFALLFQRNKKHVITIRDPRSIDDWVIEFRHATWVKKVKTFAYFFMESGFPINYSIKKADYVGVPAKFLIKKTRDLYRRNEIYFLPNIQEIPEEEPKKSSVPSVCSVGRLDKRKNPERIFALAKNMPDIKFFIVGYAHDQSEQKYLENLAKKIPNLEMVGYLGPDQKQDLAKIYEQSWVFANAAYREGLPLTFIEAASHKCAILSNRNPDEFASKFGYYCKKDDFEDGLRYLLKDDNWKKYGNIGFEYIVETYHKASATKKHIDIYERLLGTEK